MSSKIRKTTEPSRDPLCNKILTLLSSQVGLAGWEEDASLMLMPMLFTWHLIGHMVVTINRLFIKLCHWLPKVPFFLKMAIFVNLEAPFLSEIRKNSVRLVACGS